MHAQRFTIVAVVASTLLLTQLARPVVATGAPAPPVPITVVMPDEATGRLPVVYLFNAAYPGCVDDSCPDLAPILATLRAAQVITVMPTDLGYLSDYVDWRSGAHDNERMLVDLVSFVDRTYPTIAERSHRAVGGISAGGYGAMTLAAHNPDLFSAAASFSGPLDITLAGFVGQGAGLTGAPDPAAAAQAWGNPVLDELWWHAANPTDLARSLGAVAVFHSTGTGVGCPETAAEEVGPGIAIQAGVEGIVHAMNDTFDAALTAAGVPHVYRERPCGSHVYAHWAKDIEVWVASLRFDGAPPSSFGLRSAAVRADAFGWSFSAAPDRAPEFLDVEHASAEGVTLTGSGPVHVTTAPLFRPHQALAVSNSGTAEIVVADASGRLAFDVDLGPVHRSQQYTPAQRGQSALTDGYFATRAVVFSHRGAADVERRRMPPARAEGRQLPVTGARAPWERAGAALFLGVLMGRIRRQARCPVEDF